MQRVRRLAARRVPVVAALALAGGLALAGCRTDPGVAAYVGSETLTESQVDQIIDNATAATSAEKGTRAPSRSEVVITFVLGTVCAELPAKQGPAGREITAEQVGQSDTVPANSDYARQRANVYTCLSGAPVPPAGALTDAEVQDLYDRARAKGIVSEPLSGIKDQLIADSRIQEAIAVNRMLTNLVKEGDVTVNPRYRPMEFTVSDLGTGHPLIVARLGEPGSDAVRDLP